MSITSPCLECQEQIDLEDLDDEHLCSGCRAKFTPHEGGDTLAIPIPTFTPTAEQASAVSSIITWFHSTGPKFYTLMGYAGTGKTYLMSYLSKTGLADPEDEDSPHLRSNQICFTAPTNKAVKVLRHYLDAADLQACPTKTIYSLLGLSLQANGEVKELAKPEEPVDLSAFRLIVVDEGSMVNRFLMAAIEEAYDQWKVPFLFMGDPAQLPPVGETTSPIWKITDQSLLTEVKRYGNSMLGLATKIRLVVDHPFPSVKIETVAPVYRLPKPEWFDKIVENIELFKSGDAKVIAWRNVTVDKYNGFIRSNIFGTAEARANQWLPGDQIIARAPLKDLEDNTFMQNAEEAKILDIAIGTHPKHREFEIFNLLVEHESGRKFTLRTLTPTGNFHVSNRLNELSQEAKNGKKYKWREFWQLKDAFHDVRHSYAWTSHMSQGSSILKGFVDLEDIMLNRTRSEAFRSLYVACTRQREELYVS